MNDTDDLQRERVREAYAARAQEYAYSFGDMASTHPSDRALVRDWSSTVSGQVLDVGCGPGQWTNFLAAHGCTAGGIDPVPQFVERARIQYPELSFDLGYCESLVAPTGSLGGVLSWYSLIHHSPEQISTPLAEISRVIRPGGGLLVGFFAGEAVELFDHAVTTAYRWSVAELSHELATAGFDVVETHTRTGPGYRPHGAITARRKLTR